MAGWYELLTVDGDLSPCITMAGNSHRLDINMKMDRSLCFRSGWYTYIIMYVLPFDPLLSVPDSPSLIGVLFPSLLDASLASRTLSESCATGGGCTGPYTPLSGCWGL